MNESSERRGLAALLFFTFFMVLGFEMIMPLIIGRYVNEAGMSATVVAAALAARQFSQQGFALVGGALADRFQIRTLIGAGVLLRTLGFSALAFANGYGILFAAMILIGLGGVFFETPYQSALAIMTTDENRPRLYSLNNAVTGVASALGPLLGAAAVRFDFKLVCYGAASCFFINFILSRFLMPPVIRREKSLPAAAALKTIVKDKKYVMFMLLMAAFLLSASQIDIIYPLKAEEINGSPGGAGAMYATYAVVTTVLQYPLAALASKKFSSRILIAAGCGVIAAALAATAFVAAPVAFTLTVAVYAAGMSLARPNQQNAAVSMANPQALGIYLGANSVASALGKSAGTIAGGALFDIAGKLDLAAAPWYLFGILALIPMLGFLFCFRANS